jgi:hypothetical protein
MFFTVGHRLLQHRCPLNCLIQIESKLVVTVQEILPFPPCYVQIELRSLCFDLSSIGFFDGFLVLFLQ